MVIFMVSISLFIGKLSSRDGYINSVSGGCAERRRLLSSHFSMDSSMSAVLYEHLVNWVFFFFLKESK